MAGPDLGEVTRRLREISQDVAAAARLTRDLPEYLRHPMNAAQIRDGVTRRLADRPERLLTTVERTIYRNPRSPYLKLLRMAGCEAGVEGALQSLVDRGVYVTYDELKGRREAVRGSQRFTFRQEDFDNPSIGPHLIVRTGGTSGRPSRVGLSLEHFKDWAGSLGITLQAHGAGESDQVYWWQVPFQGMLGSARIGRPPIAWFYPMHPLPPVLRLAGYYLVLLSWLAGRPLPLPRRADLDAPAQMVDWMMAQVAAGRTLTLRATPSVAMRAATHAVEAGKSLRGVTFMLSGEAVTDARRRQIESAGAHLIVRYASIELMGLSYSCATPRSADDVHVMLDMYGFAQRRREAFPDGPVVDATLFTTLGPAAAKIAFNAELGDYAQIEERDCDCLLGQLGMRVHLSEIRSFEKLTGEGVTFARSNLETILDEVLPARFGGTGLDYQVAEEEAPDGATRLILRVSPSVGALDEEAVRTALLDELGRANVVNRYHAGIWRSAQTIQIRREAPLATRGGKVLPFHLLRHSGAASEHR
jgi:phenylacetate-coenzyme A ligase PaaK-like adenylate-forming protein